MSVLTHAARVASVVSAYPQHRETTNRKVICQILGDIFDHNLGSTLTPKEREVHDERVFEDVCKVMGISRKCSRSVWDLASSCCCPCEGNGCC